MSFLDRETGFPVPEKHVMSLEVPVSKTGLTQNGGDEACWRLQGHDALQNEEVPLLGIRLPVLRNFAGKKLRKIWQDRMLAR